MQQCSNQGSNAVKTTVAAAVEQDLLYSADSAAAGLQKGNGSNKYIESNSPKRALEYEAEIYKSFVSPKRLFKQDANAVANAVVVAGVDESKRGCYFGPLVAVAYVVDEEKRQQLQAVLAPKGVLRDSKQLTKARRKALLEEVMQCGTWRIGYARASEVDENINAANNLAFKRAIAKLPTPPTKVLVDGNKRILGLGIEQEAIPKGDCKELAIAAASILCKEFSDDLVERLGAKLPHNFAKHHGYSCDADLQLYGAEHRQFRKSFKSVKRALENKETNDMVASIERTTEWIERSRAVYQGQPCQIIKLGTGAYKNKARIITSDFEEKWVLLNELEKVSEPPVIQVDAQPKTRETDEQYTPNTEAQPVLRLVAEVLGGIGVDVCADAGRNVSAEHYITKEQNYLVTSIKGMRTAFMNPIYSNPLPFVEKLCADFKSGDIEAAIMLLKSGTAHNKGTGALIKKYASAQCQWGVHTGRIGFIKDGVQRLGADFDCTLVYLGRDWRKFQEVFEPWGLVGLLPVATNQENSTPMAQSSSFYENRDRAFEFEILEVHPDLINTDLDTQCRSKESQERIDECVALMQAGEWDIECKEPFHELPELVPGEEGQYYPLSHHRVKAAKRVQLTLKYKVWKPMGANLSVARFLSAASNPQKGQPWLTADHRKRVAALLDGWEQMSVELKDRFIEALNGVIEGQQLTRLRNSRELSDYAIANILTIPPRTVTNHRKVWENQGRVRASGIKLGDRVCVVEALKSFVPGETGTVADIDSKKAEVWVSWDGQPGQAPFPIPLANIEVTTKPRDAVVHFSVLVDLLAAINGDGWNRDVLVAHQESGVEFDGYRARYSSLKTGYWFVSPNDERLASLLESVKQSRQQLKEIQSNPNSVLPEIETEEGGETISQFEEQTGTTPEQYDQAATVVPPLEPLPYSEGEIVMVKFDKAFGAKAGLECLGEVRKVEQLRCIVYFGLHQVEHPINVSCIKKVPDSQQQEVKEMHKRIDELCKYELDPVDLAVLEQLSRMTEYSDRAYRLLDNLEREYEGTAIRQVIEEFRS